MSIIEKLTEGIVNRDMKAEGSALLDKWSATGLLEGLETQHQKATMSRLLENQAKELLRESSSMAGGDVEGFAAVAFPIVRRVFAGLIANDLVSVQPMSLPSGLIFFLDFVYSPTLKGTDSDANDRFGNQTDTSIYGTDKVGAGVIEGVGLLGSRKEDLGGPGRGGSVGYAYGSAEGQSTEATNDAADAAIAAVIDLSSPVSDANKKLLQYDADILSLNSGGVIAVSYTHLTLPTNA